MAQIINKPFTTVEDQVKILERRGVLCDKNTPKALLREGYYAIINGYKAPFLDTAATRAAGEERYVPGTRFDDIYGLFRFDRDRLIGVGHRELVLHRARPRADRRHERR